MSPEELWDQLRSSFESDDGSLPEIAIVGLHSEEVGRLYARIRSDGELKDKAAAFWDYETNSERRLSDAPDVAERVVARKAGGFTFVMQGISFDGEVLPDLGFQVAASLIVIFYRMGKEWNANRLCAFCSWLKILVANTQDSRLDFDHGPGNTFPRAWQEFLAG
jgi:hypothetical protein